MNVRLRETAPNVYRLDHDPDRHDDRAVALAMGVTTLATVPRPGGPVIFSDEDDIATGLGLNRGTRKVSEAVPLVGGRAYGGDTSMPDTVHRSDEDEAAAALRGKTMKSPFV